MGEGVATASGTIVADGVHDDPEHPPAPDPVHAPKGWTWARDERRWKPRIRGPLLTVVPQQEAVQQQAAAQQDGPQEGWQPRDPDPSWMADDAAPAAAFEVDAETRADIRALVALAYAIPGEALPLLDPYCFGCLENDKTSRAIIGSVSDIICGSPRIARWAASAAGLMPWIKLGYALKPVAVASFHHHVLRDVEVELDRASKTMTVAKRDWSAFPAA